MSRYHGARHLLAAQRKALLLISRAYKNTSSSALQVLTGIPPVDLQLEAEAEFARVSRLGISSTRLNAQLYATKVSKYKLPSTLQQIKTCSTQDFRGDIHIFTDGSKTIEGTASDFCAYKDQNLIHTWRARLDAGNSVFQAELLAIGEAVRWVLDGDSMEILISSDSLSSLMALSKFDVDNYFIQDLLLTIQNSNKTFYFN